MKALSIALLLCVAPAAAFAEMAPYQGQEARAIKALDADRVAGLLSGAGLGYAKAAELNGWPGPLHALELAEELALSDEQKAALTAKREAMLAAAIPLGAELVAAEAALDAMFAEGPPLAEAVAAATDRAASIEGALRAVHLAAHIATRPLLTRHQTMLYMRHRGYGGAHGHSHQGGH